MEKGFWIFFIAIMAFIFIVEATWVTKKFLKFDKIVNMEVSRPFISLNKSE